MNQDTDRLANSAVAMLVHNADAINSPAETRPDDGWEGQADGAAEASALDNLFATALLSPHGRVIRANANYLRLFGSTHDQLIGRRRRDLTTDDAITRHNQEELWASLRRGETRMLTYLAIREDGLDFWVEGVFTPCLNSSGELCHVVEIATDITHRQHLAAEHRGQLEAIDASRAVVHLSIEGRILDANLGFLTITGYGLKELVGYHYDMLVDKRQVSGTAHAEFWTELVGGRHQTGEFRRIGKDGRELWLQSIYSPIFDQKGCLLKIVSYATDVTAEKISRSNFQWQVAAIHKSHAVITFDMDGLILDANAIFLDALGYALEEIEGRHHRLFVDPAYAHSADYAAFWRELARGHHQTGQYRRVAKDGSGVWLQATYNPVFDTDGRPIRVVKYATVVTDEKLRQADHQGQIAAIHKSQCVVSFGLDGTILDANDNFLWATGYRLAEIKGRHHRMFVDPEQAASASYAGFWPGLAAGQYHAGEIKRLGKNGREIWLQATYNPIFDLSGRPFRVIKYATDITAVKLQQADFQGQIEAISKSQAVVAFALDGTILEVNDAFLKTVGYSHAELVGNHHSVLVDHGYAVSSEYEEFWAGLRAGIHHSALYKRIAKNGDSVWIQASYNPILDLNGHPFKIVKFATDVTSNVALAEAYEDAKRQAQHDAATSLPNRVRLDAFMAEALRTPGSSLVTFYLDLDNFKRINDTHGHVAGDRVLGEVADRLRRLLSFDQLAARVGGDEFVVVAPDLAGDEVEAFAQRLIDTVATPVCYEAEELPVGASVGISVAPMDGITPDGLLRAADMALYRSKQTGRGAFSFYTATLNDRLTSYRNTVEDLRRALVEEQFVVEYQPRFETGSRRVRSVEALVRWNHPERGRVPPVEFISAAERSGVIVPLGEWVLAKACRDAAAWPSIGVSVNVSPIQFHVTDVIAVTTRILAETGMKPDRLELEITEGVLLQDAERAHATLHGLNKLGVRLAMDDFGTGYSSLSSLRSFPFDVIKIDRQFITDMDERKGGRDVVRAILGLGKALGLSVTAEGVETSQQLAMLTTDGCDEVQGFLLARPMSTEKIGTLIAGQHKAAELLQAG